MCSPPNPTFLFYVCLCLISHSLPLLVRFTQHTHTGHGQWSILPLPLLSLTPLCPTLNFSTAFNTTAVYSLPSQMYVLQYYFCSVIFFSFPSFPEFHRVVPLLQTWSTYEFVYDHACFCVYVYLLYLSFMYKRKHLNFVFLSLAYFN
jgi:hypothetical protein